jgi:tetratricopeptide (TPR) repeat protein
MKKLLDKLKGETEGGRQERIKELQDAIKKEPSGIDNYIELSNVFYKLGNYDESIKIANEALKVKKESARAYNQLCIAYNKKEEWDKGIEAGLKAVEIEPKYQKARNNLKWSIKGKAKVLGKDPQVLADELGIKVKFSKPKNNESKKDSN